MAQSKTPKPAGATRKSAAGSGGKSSTGSRGKSAGTGSARKTAGSPRRAAGSASSSGTGSGGKSSRDGSARKTATSGGKSGTGPARKAAGSAGKTASGSPRKAAPGPSATGSARKSAGSDGKSRASSARNASTSEPETGIYVYGILPADVELTSGEMPGVGDPPGEVGVVRYDGLAALVSEVQLSGQLGSPDDLRAHKEILDACAAELPVLPMRFGAVLASEDAVADELLAVNHDEFAAALDELDGRTQYIVHGRYVEEAILDEILSENRRAARLRDQIRGQDADATRDARIQLGQIINEAVSAKRQEDTRILGDAMQGHCAASCVREPSHELDAAYVAFLVDADQEHEMEQVIDDLGEDWEGRIEIRLQGPMAAYDFVGALEPEG